MDSNELAKIRSEWGIRYAQTFEKLNTAAKNSASRDELRLMLEDLDTAYDVLRHIDRLMVEWPVEPF